MALSVSNKKVHMKVYARHLVGITPPQRMHPRHTNTDSATQPNTRAKCSHFHPQTNTNKKKTLTHSTRGNNINPLAHTSHRAISAHNQLQLYFHTNHTGDAATANGQTLEHTARTHMIIIVSCAHRSIISVWLWSWADGGGTTSLPPKLEMQNASNFRLHCTSCAKTCDSVCRPNIAVAADAAAACAAAAAAGAVVDVVARMKML